MKSVHAQTLITTAILLIAGSLPAQQTNINYTSTKNKEITMTNIEKNKEVIQKLYDECLNTKKMQLLPEFIAPEFTGIQGLKGAAAFQKPVNDLIDAFPDIHWTLQEVIGDGNKVAVKWKWQGTHAGTFVRFAPTGKTVQNEGMAVFELKDGKVVGAQVLTDRMGFFQAMEAIPVDLTLVLNKHAYKNRVNFIDKFLVPAEAKAAFLERMQINRNFIKKLPGFIEDAAYTYTDDQGNLICVTVATWQSKEALVRAKEAVQEEYKKQGFDPAEMFKKMHITVDRGIYSEVQE